MSPILTISLPAVKLYLWCCRKLRISAGMYTTRVLQVDSSAFKVHIAHEMVEGGMQSTVSFCWALYQGSHEQGKSYVKQRHAKLREASCEKFN